MSLTSPALASGFFATRATWDSYETSVLIRGGQDSDTQRDDPLRTWGEDGCLQAEERGLRRDQPCHTLGLGFQPPGLEA